MASKNRKPIDVLIVKVDALYFGGRLYGYGDEVDLSGLSPAMKRLLVDLQEKRKVPLPKAA